MSGLHLALPARLRGPSVPLCMMRCAAENAAAGVALRHAAAIGRNVSAAGRRLCLAGARSAEEIQLDENSKVPGAAGLHVGSSRIAPRTRSSGPAGRTAPDCTSSPS